MGSPDIDEREPGWYWAKRKVGADEWLPVMLTVLGDAWFFSEVAPDCISNVAAWGPRIEEPRG